MSPELEQLLNAFWERDTCEPKDQSYWKAMVERLIQVALSKQQGLNRQQFLDAMAPRYKELRRARRKPQTMPPKA
ncbi:MAG: hypothetical protein C5B50_09500 [Verrucomicrobia bacterium]|nr:MAG: hypothetical protein C5B50_09500 [Verrucomicrobiota bacterium]